MKIYHPIFIKNIVFFTIIASIFLFGLWGVKPSYADIFAQVNNFRLAAFPIGLSLYQQDRPFFYNITPYNDYFINNADNHQTFVTKTDVLEGRFVSDLNKNSLKNKFDYLLSLFNLLYPRIIFANNGPKIEYLAEVNGDDILVNRKISNFNIQSVNKTALSLSYDCRDFVFDHDLNLYSLKSDQEVSEFISITNLPLNKISVPENIVLPTWENISSSKIYIYSNLLRGVIQIQAETDQKLTINRTYCLIAAEKKVSITNNKEINDHLRLKVLDNFQEII